MNLTSLRRVLISLNEDDPLDTTQFKYRRRFVKRIASVSRRIANFLDKNIELTTYTEYFDVKPGQINFWVKATPISSITSVASDSTGEFDGSEVSEVNYYIGQNSQSIVLEGPVSPAVRGLKVVYIGGYANHGVNSVFELTSEGSTAIAAGNYVQGETSEAVGYVVSKSGSTLTVEVLYGVFEDGEDVNAKVAEDSASIANTTATIDSVTSRGLAEAYPDIVEACELEIRYMDDHRSDYENQSTIKGQTNRGDLMRNYNLLPEVRSMLQPYKRISV